MKLEGAAKFKAAAGILLKGVLPVVAGLAVLIIVIAWLAGVMVEKIEPGQSDAVVRRVDPNQEQGIYEVREVFKNYTAEAVGTLKASSRTEISARVLASIDQIDVSAGQTVSAGDVLVELDRRTLETQLSQAQASRFPAAAFWFSVSAGQSAPDKSNQPAEPPTAALIGLVHCYVVQSREGNSSRPQSALVKPTHKPVNNCV